MLFSLEIQTIISGVFIIHIAIKTYINMVQYFDNLLK